MGSRDAALELLSDGHTAAPLVRLGYLHSLRGGRSYFLHFRHQSGERDFTQVSNCQYRIGDHDDDVGAHNGVVIREKNQKNPSKLKI